MANPSWGWSRPSSRSWAWRPDSVLIALGLYLVVGTRRETPMPPAAGGPMVHEPQPIG